MIANTLYLHSHSGDFTLMTNIKNTILHIYKRVVMHLNYATFQHFERFCSMMYSSKFQRLFCENRNSYLWGFFEEPWMSNVYDVTVLSVRCFVID